MFLFSYLEATADSEDDEAALLFALECSILFKADKYARAEETTISVSAPVAVNVLVPLVSVWLEPLVWEGGYPNEFGHPVQRSA